MDVPGSDGWVCEGDKAPSFELPDSHLKPTRPIETKTKVRGLAAPGAAGLLVSYTYKLICVCTRSDFHHMIWCVCVCQPGRWLLLCVVAWTTIPEVLDYSLIEVALTRPTKTLLVTGI